MAVQEEHQEQQDTVSRRKPFQLSQLQLLLPPLQRFSPLVLPFIECGATLVVSLKQSPGQEELQEQGLQLCCAPDSFLLLSHQGIELWMLR